MRIKGVLFDKDGTLIDFTATWRDTVEQIAEEFADGDAELARALCEAVGYDPTTQVFLPGSPVVAGSVDMVAELMAALLPTRTAAEIEERANRAALEEVEGRVVTECVERGGVIRVDHVVDDVPFALLPRLLRPIHLLAHPRHFHSPLLSLVSVNEAPTTNRPPSKSLPVAATLKSPCA